LLVFLSVLVLFFEFTYWPRCALMSPDPDLQANETFFASCLFVCLAHGDIVTGTWRAKPASISAASELFVVLRRWFPFDIATVPWAANVGLLLGVRELQGPVEQENREEDKDVEHGEHSANFAGSLLGLRVLHARVLDVEVPAPVGEHDGQRAGDEGDDPDARLAVAAVQEADQGEKEEEAEEDVEIPLKPELIDGRLTEHVELKANPYEGEKQAKCRKNEAIEFETPSEGGDPGTPQLDLKTLLLVAIATTRR